jgi:hypothetical protein
MRRVSILDLFLMALLWVASLVVLGVIAKAAVNLFCFGYGC